MSDFAVVVPVFNRPAALGRLLRALGAALPGPQPTPLIFSLDGDSTAEVAALCEAFAWPHGKKQIRRRQTHLGLREHLLACGDLTREFSAVIVLEDDLYVAPGFLRFAQEAVAFYASEERVAGISLYGFCVNDLAKTPFVPLDDGYATYFVQSTASWGQVWTRTMWRAFRAWLGHAPPAQPRFEVLPPLFSRWPETSWKKLFNLYLVEAGRYFVVPRRGYSTNMGEIGTHYRRRVTWHTAPLTLAPWPAGRLAPFGPGACRYDAFFEVEPETLRRHAPHLEAYDFAVDLLGQKEQAHLAAPLTLTLRPAPGEHTRCAFGLRFFPPALNVIFHEPGEVFRLAETAALDRNEEATEEMLARIRDFYRMR